MTAAAPGRHCAVCGGPGGSGLTAAGRLVHAEYVRHGLRSPLQGVALVDVKVHGPCMQRIKRQLAEQVAQLTRPDLAPLTRAALDAMVATAAASALAAVPQHLIQQVQAAGNGKLFEHNLRSAIRSQFVGYLSGEW